MNIFTAFVVAVMANVISDYIWDYISKWFNSKK